MSSGQNADGSGASLQEREAEILEASDAMMLSEALNEYLDTWAIRYYLGDEEPLAYIQVKTSTRKNIEQDLKVDQQLHGMGFPLSLQSISERYSRPIPDAKDALLPPPTRQSESTAAPSIGPAANSKQGAIAQDTDSTGAILAEARMAMQAPIVADLKPIADRVAAIVTLMDEGASDEELKAAVARFLNDELPGLAAQIIREPSGIEAYVEAMSAALANGIEAAAEATR